MRLLLILCYLFVLTLFGCIDDPVNRIYIKSVSVSNGERVDWYVYSRISSIAPDYIQTNKFDGKPFFKTFYLTDISFRKDSLFIYLLKNDYELDTSYRPGISIIIDTLGQPWNRASSRLGRLKKRGVNIDSPHFVNSSCDQGECE